jgi:flagellar biogenesis protein FliO
VAGALLFGLSLRKIDRLPLSPAPLQFSGQRAWESMRDLAKGFPNRVTWDDSRRKAATWLKNQFKQMGYTPRGMQFSEVIAGRQYNDLENIYVEKKGTTRPDEIIVAMAHYDITDTTVEGAMDDASGVGVVLELARIFAREQTERTVLFLLTDSEEFGAFWGARMFTQLYPRADKIVAAMNFDFVAPEKQVAILTLCDGLKDGFTPLWLRELALDSLRSLGADFEARDFTNLMEFFERAMLIPAADHGPFLAAGIPAFNWVGQMENFGYEMAHYHHTKHDVVEAMRPESFHDYGRGAERLLRSLDELPKIPENFRENRYWKLSQHFYVHGGVSTILHILAFIPFLAYSLARFRGALRGRPRERLRAVFKNEAKNLAIVLASLLLGYVVVLLLPALRVITQYEVFPATQKSAILYTPNLLAMILVFACIGAVFWALHRTFREDHDLTADTEVRHAFHGAFLAAIIFLAFLKNSYLGSLLLLPPAYFWMTLRASRRPADRVLNGLLLAGGGITFVTMTAVMSTVFHVGVVYWYLFLSTAYGLFSAYAVVLFFMALSVMIRLFRTYVL